jgi:hypothetical protein
MPENDLKEIFEEVWLLSLTNEPDHDCILDTVKASLPNATFWSPELQN